MGDRFGIIAHAWCTTCGREWHTKNAHAVGAAHARRHNHTVCVEEARNYTYNAAPCDPQSPVADEARRR